ncbi:hypothetical protein FG386_000792 [Cryptosporidium ryanae]|uniref:uncharacterized protein n=1 Tax=Cryptosporidium ryanae TaxID=515981 RepID=UPI00351A2C34|nr:hypothetical protein FG386_000792 [Cryptosporidium ryanae]
MNKKENITKSKFCLYIFFIINLICVKGENIENAVNIKLNRFEEKIVTLGLNIPITASWQLILVLLSSENCRICMTHPPKELTESKESTLLRLSKPWLFFIHPAKNITSEILTAPRIEFLNYISKYIEIDRCMTQNGQKDVNSIVVTKRNLLGCNLMIREMLETGFLQINKFNELIESESEQGVNELDNILKCIFEQQTPDKDQSKCSYKRVIETREINRLCGSFLLKISKMIYTICGMTSVSFRKKTKAYNKICMLLETT